MQIISLIVNGAVHYRAVKPRRIGNESAGKRKRTAWSPGTRQNAGTNPSRGQAGHHRANGVKGSNKESITYKAVCSQSERKRR